jgi:8-oxo-dGTP pyrophosphatase MutT (NUDIX family)
MKQLHPLQIKILQKLLFSQSLRYSQMKPLEDIENNKFNFHLKKLMEDTFILKEGSQYYLSDAGKEFANRIGTDIKLNFQAKVSVIIVPIRNSKEILVHTRLKQPWYGRQGYMSGKVNLGETVYDAAKREFKEETNLEGDVGLFLIRHDVVFNKSTTELLEDKFLFCFVSRNPIGKLHFLDEGKFEWINYKDLQKYITKPYTSVKTTLEFTRKAINFRQTKTPEFEERISYTET